MYASLSEGLPSLSLSNACCFKFQENVGINRDKTFTKINYYYYYKHIQINSIRALIFIILYLER